MHLKKCPGPTRTLSRPTIVILIINIAIDISTLYVHCRVSDAGGQLQFTQVKSGEVGKTDFNSSVSYMRVLLLTSSDRHLI